MPRVTPGKGDRRKIQSSPSETQATVVRSTLPHTHRTFWIATPKARACQGEWPRKLDHSPGKTKPHPGSSEEEKCHELSNKLL